MLEYYVKDKDGNLVPVDKNQIIFKSKSIDECDASLNEYEWEDYSDETENLD